MSARKPSSTNYQNEESILSECPIYGATRLIAARWRTHVLWFLREGPLRFSEIRRSIPLATERMIALRIKDLTADGLIEKVESTTGPAYRLTRKGKKLIPILAELFRVEGFDPG